jgi:hypothetical protein
MIEVELSIESKVKVFRKLAKDGGKSTLSLLCTSTSSSPIARKQWLYP